MRVKKMLREQAAADHEKILNRNKAFYEKTVEEHYSKKARYKPNLKLVLMTCSITIVIIAAVVCAVLFAPNDDQSPKKGYLSENEVNREATLSEINDDLIISVLTIGEGFQHSATLKYDSLSGDKLAYKLRIENEVLPEIIQLSIKVNEYYDYSTDIENPQETVINNFTVIFGETYQFADGIYIFTTIAIMDTGEEIFYIEYEQYSFDPISNFVPFLQSLIQRK
ncbi:hypothetical protein EOM82_09800 [bacterium]|nr:hypothetical protein [bacterium]